MAKGIEGLLVASEDEGGGSDKEDAAQDLIDAVKAGDAKAVALAFEALYEHCGMAPSDDDESDDEEAEEAYGG